MTVDHTTSLRAFIVEDDPFFIRLIRFVFELQPDIELHIFQNGRDCIKNLHLNPDIVSLDYSLPDMDGAKILQTIKQHDPDIAVIILSGQEDISVAVNLLKEGADDYIVKNDDTKERLENSLRLIKANQSLKQEVKVLREQLNQQYDFQKNIIGNSKPIQKVFRLIEKAVRTDITVSITGETGTGKEVVARSIHYNSSRRKKPFVAVNVSAIPKDLLESELFGYEKGAFTGANSRKIGKFEQAHGGTLFLDEIAEMEISLQAKLLHALQEREITRIGGQDVIKFDARIITATHRSLSEEVAAGNFREDLYFRVLGLPIQLPPLRERGKDILLLMRYFLTEFTSANNLGKIGISTEAKDKLLEYAWPGNVRELKAVIELAAVMTDHQMIEAEDIRFSSPKPIESFLGQERTLKDYTRQIIHHFLGKYDGNVIKVAQKLDIGKSTIYRLLKEEQETKATEVNPSN